MRDFDFFDIASDLAYVANDGSGTVTPITTATNTAGKPVKVGLHPGQIVITPDGKTVYVDSYRGTVVPIRTATNTAGQAIRAGQGGALAVTPDGKTVYVASYGQGIITPIRTATGTAAKPVKVGRHPAAIAITR